MCSDGPTNWLFPHLSPCPWASLFPETRHYESRPGNHPAMASKCLNEKKKKKSRVNPTSYFPKKLEMGNAKTGWKLGLLHQTQVGKAMENMFVCLLLFRAIPKAYGSSQARGPIGATTAGLHHSHSNMGSKPHLQPTPQLTAMLDPWLTERDQGLNLHPHGY